ncbi:type IV pilin protein [Prochlorococcus marinus]|uniref:type IV pilin protein n=1 Tax=Prochlorococcus marinus TaxID=1219 RepID=UPI0022B2E349|nr:hypothetical protein [Prochlorococcus marinus]
MEQELQHIILKKFSRNKGEGFSLIELVVIVSVLAVLASITLPTFGCITRKAKAMSALTALKQIQMECAVKGKEDGGDVATFVTSNLQSYEIESDISSSCNGALGTGLIRAIPNEPDQLPTFILATNNNELTYSFKGVTGTNFTECLGMICVSSNSNKSVLFGPDSGLSCREARSNNLGRVDFAIGWLGSGVINDGDTVDLILQPVTIIVGDKTWLVDDVQTTITYYHDPSKHGREWLNPFAQKAVDVINASDGEFSAEVDPDNPYTFNIYSSKGTEIDQISMSVDKTVDGKGITPISSVPLNDKKPWAFPTLSTWDSAESNRVNLSSVSTNENNGSTLNQNSVVICDGR